MAIDPRHLKPSELVRLLNSTSLGEVTSERRLYRDRQRAGFRVGDGNRVDLVRYTAWLAWERHNPKPVQTPESYEQLKDRTARRSAELSAAGRDIGDLPAIADAARRLPGWTFVLIGRIETDLAPIEGLANIRLAPPVSHDSLPSWSQHWTVSLLPFVRNRQIDASNPLKLREYLAAGRPVAATYAFPAIRDLQAPVSTPGTGKTLADAILEAETRTGEARAFVSRLATQGWDARAAHVASLIDAL